MKESNKVFVDRRKFLKGAALGGAATLVTGPAAFGASPQEAPPASPPETPPHSAPLMAPPESDPPPWADVQVLGPNQRAGSDFMIDVIKSLGFEYMAANPGSTFRGLHESLVNYGGNKAPEFITCCHEEASVAISHGYAAIEGKPMLNFVHSTVGLQHASMAIYNAYAGKIPVFVIVANVLNATERRPGAEWDHAAVDVVEMVRDYIKWDDMPVSLPHFAESTVRAYSIAMTPPRLPVAIVADGALQELPIPPYTDLTIPKLTVEQPPQGDSGSVAEAARILVAANNPVIVAGYCTRTEEGVARLIELAETLQAPVIDEGGNFPTRHPLNQSIRGHALLHNADAVLGLEVEGFWATFNSYADHLYRVAKPTVPKDARRISISTLDLYIKGNYQNIQRYVPVDLAMAADAETTLPSLIDACKRLVTDDRKSAFADRRAKLIAAKATSIENARVQMTYGWNASPVSVPRLIAEMWEQIKDEDWALVGDRGGPSGGGDFLWNFEKRYQRLQGGNAVGMGFSFPASLGAALAHKKHGRFAVSFQTDGDLMYSPGVFWTAAHHRIPILWVLHNNRAWHQEVMHVQRMANRRQRDVATAYIGTTIWDPFINYAKVAEGMGVYSEGPISNPNDVGPALKRAIAVVKKGEPAVVDVVTQPR